MKKFSAAQSSFFLASVLLLHVSAQLHAPEVHTKLGALRGQSLGVKGTENMVDAYLGIPFAKPPVGPAHRLAAPQPVEGWEGVRDATKQPLMCIQMRQLMIDLLGKVGMMVDVPEVSEDCLYLNVYTPANRDPSAKLPVMVWIYGGGFTIGAASLYDGSALAAYQDVVVVVIQYRLGLLGFLSTGDEHAPGNYGLLDQVEALRWVQQHIHSFGGDPDLVTIFGESAGGMSVSLLLLSSLTDGLVHRGIAESGTAALDQIVNDYVLPSAKMVANISGCSLESTKEMADCIRNLDMDAILALGENPELRYPINTDGHFLKKPVAELFQKHELLAVPFMTGVNDHEGGFLLPSYLAPPNWTEGMDREYVLGVLSAFNANPEVTVAQDLMLEEYIGSGEDRVRNRDGFTEALGDIFFTIPAIVTANAHRDAGAPVYLYEYKHAPSALKKLRPSFVRSDHGDELLTVFGYCFTTSHVTLNDTCTEEEYQFSKTMMSYWANFARTGSPNGDGLVHWPKYGVDEEYLSLDLEQQVSGQHLKKDRFVLLTQTIPEKVQTLREKKEHGEL